MLGILSKYMHVMFYNTVLLFGKSLFPPSLPSHAPFQLPATYMRSFYPADGGEENCMFEISPRRRTTVSPTNTA